MSGKAKIAVIAWAKATSRAIAGQLNSLFGSFFEFSSFSLSEWEQYCGETDLVLISTHTLTSQVAQRIKKGTEIIVLRRSILKYSWEKVVAVPPGKKIMLVNDERDSAVETIALLYELGARHIELVPVYPGLNNVPQLETAITPGEPHLVPDFVKEIIDIGDRVVDVSTMVDILSHFNLLNDQNRRVLAAYAEQLIPRSHGLQVTMQGLSYINDLLQKTLNEVHDGVIVYDDRGVITIFNRVAEVIFNRNAWEVIGQDINIMLEQEGINGVLEDKEISDILLQIRQQNIVLTKLKIKTVEKTAGGVLTLQIATKVQELEQKLRTQLKAKGHKAKYFFENLIFKSEKMRFVVNRAKKMAGTDLNVLILGETGTGKELFAHAIHNLSPRETLPFVAINCSALPDSLLESELFGYEEGAFTGARKGGKPGLFEQAHGGTIFLDEIGDISQNLQGRLLRVIQQKEVLKIGGTKILPVNVRVIAATNRDLFKLVAEGKFRADLYHRLKVLHFEVPPLRERKEDIPLLAIEFLNRMNFTNGISQAAMDVLIQYDWPGNIRELENTMEYLAVMSNGSIESADIPFFAELSQGLTQPESNNL